MITGGRNLGRVGLVMHRERHPGSFDIVHVKDSAGKPEWLESWGRLFVELHSNTTFDVNACYLQVSVFVI